MLDRRIRQRAPALNAFIYDVYHRGEIIRAGIVPADLVYRNRAFEPQMIGFDPPGGVYSHIVGIDIVRTDEHGFQVLEDNCRTPSGVSYMLENREIMQRMFPALFASTRVAPVDSYPNDLLATLKEVAPAGAESDPTVVVLTPGPFNSAYYEHSFLADLMGVELVEPRDLYVDDDRVWMKTTHGPRRVDVIYRRIDDDYLDPLAFKPDSMLRVPGLFGAYRGRHDRSGAQREEKAEAVDPNVLALLARKPARVVTVALGNKTARIAWAIMARGEVYRERRVPALAA